MMDIITIDMETYYDSEYSLTKITTEQYVRSSKFEIIGVGVKINDYPTDWYSGEHVGRFLNSLNYRDKAILCHNTAFDGAILSWHFGIKPKLWLDTLSMARPLHQLTVGGSLKALAQHYGLGAKGDEVFAAIGKRRKDFTPDELARYGAYCVNDVEITKALFDKLKVGFPVTELLVIDQTIRMFTEPVIELDEPLLQKHLEEVRTRKRTLMADLGHGVGGEEAVRGMLMSNPQFAQYLKSLGVEPPTKISGRTGKETYAFGKTDKAFTDLLEHPDERVQAAVAARMGVKSTLEETRTEALIGVSQRGTLPVMLNYYGAHTGRFSGGDKLNLQNLPSRDGKNTIRRALKAPKGHVVIACDSAQIEARTVAWVAGQDDLVRAFREKRDVYSEFATEVYGRKITKADKVERFVGKTCIAEGTLVLAERGWVPIESVTTDDLLWDGEEWVRHQGLLDNGVKPTLNMCGAWLTPDHRVWSGTEWLETQLVVADESILYQVLAAGAENLPSQTIWQAPEVGSNAESQTLRRVYDISNCGSRNRFTILTESGPVIAHNCILGLGYGMGAERLQRTLEIGAGGIRVKVTSEEAARIVQIYRAKNHKIVQFWRKCDNALNHMINGMSGHLHDTLTYDNTGITFPNKFKIQYPALRVTDNRSEFEYIADARMYRKALKDRMKWTKIYGGKVTENIVQALAAIVIREQMAAVGQYYKVVFQVHDEIVIVAPEEQANAAQAKLEAIMSVPPKWAPDLPVACESGYAVNYGDT